MITINRIEQINDETQLVMFTLTKDGNNYPWTANSPVLSGGELQAWLDNRLNHYNYSTLISQYPDAPAPARKSLEDMEAWIASGAKYREKIGKDENGKDKYGPEKTAKKVKWKGKHPGPTPDERIDTLDLRIEALEQRVRAIESGG